MPAEYLVGHLSFLKFLVGLLKNLSNQAYIFSLIFDWERLNLGKQIVNFRVLLEVKLQCFTDVRAKLGFLL